MKTITVVVNEGEVSAFDVPDDVSIRICNVSDASAPEKLANGKMATVTIERPDSEVFKDLYVNSMSPLEGVPSRPDIVYADEWQGWADFFGWVPKKEGEDHD